MEQLILSLQDRYPKLNFSKTHSMEVDSISSLYSASGELTIRGPRHLDWLHELCHLVEREDNRLVKGSKNWALGNGTFFHGSYVFLSSAPWEREVRVWTWQVCVMRHFGISESEIMSTVLPQYVAGDRPSCCLSGQGKEQRFVMRFINMKLRLLKKKYSYEAFVKELHRKLDFMLE